MAGRENEVENSIELIASDHRSEPHTAQFMLHGPSINLFPSNSSVKSQTEAENDRASLNALKVAFNSLQGYHNEQAKKLFSLQRKYILLQEYVQNTNGNIDLGFLEQSYPQDQSSMAQAAGAYNETHEFQNAILQRERMRNSQTIAMNKQILAQNEKLNDKDELLKGYLKERERLMGDVEALSIVLDEKKAEIVAKDKNLKELNEKIVSLQTELESRNDILRENEHFRQRIELYERTVLQNDRDTEKDELRVRLRNIQEECERLRTLYEQQNSNLDVKDKEITKLQSRCKQFEIENSILRSQRNEGTDMVDSGTNAELEKALELVKKQSTEIKALRNTAQQQNTVIQGLINKAKQSVVSKPGELRGHRIAEGESGHYFGDYDRRKTEHIEQPNAFIYGPQNLRDPTPVRSEIISAVPRYSNFSEPGKLSVQRPIGAPSPQIKDSIVPTGSRNIMPMVAQANENLQPNIPAVNVLDCPVNVDASPRPVRFRASDSDLTRLSGHSEIVQKNNSSSLSPPGIWTRTRDQHAHVNHGAKPKAIDRLGFPSRMTQSEIIYGNLPTKQDKEHEDTTKYGSLTRSSFYPPPDMNRKLENRPVRIPEEHSAIPNQIRLSDNEPDYENIYQSEQTEEKIPDAPRESNRIIYENFTGLRTTDGHKNSDGTSFVVVPSTINNGKFGYNRIASINVSGGDQVNSLKICPSCNREFSRLSTEEFQLHVYDCFDSSDEPNTLQAQGNVSQEDDRSCPMCGETFPIAIPQDTFEAHVLAHFGEEAPFEIVNT